MAGTSLLEISAAVSDGRSVDWARAEREAEGPEELRVVRNLRLVESVSSLHRSAHGAGPGEATVDAVRPASSRPASGRGTLFRWGGLEMLERIGEGASGEVYRAFDPTLEREVAVKLLKAEPSLRADLASRVLHEGRLLARVRHPNVVIVHGADVHDGRVGLSMEFVRGRSLAQLVAQQGTLGAREAAVLGADVCRALAAVHRAGLVHRDVKAANVMREDGGRVLLMDFGIGSGTEQVEAGSFSGTPLYMAPEVYAGAKATPRSDLYGAGVLLYHLVTGRHPVEAKSLDELRDKMARKESRLLRDERPDLPDSFVRVVERALAWDPADRFATAGEMGAALADSLGREGAVAGVREPAGRAIGRGNARRAIVAVGLVAAAGVVGALVIFGPFGSRPAPPAKDPGATPKDAELAAQPPVQAAYSVDAGLFRVRADGSRERIESGGRLRLGDQLALELRASRSVHAYVINEDEQGRAFVLFPLPGQSPRNPLPSDTTHVLPGRDGSGQSVYWRVDTAGGREHLLVLVSPERLVEFEAEMANLPRPVDGATAMALPEDVKVRLRGIGGLARVPEPLSGSASGSRLFDLAEKLAGRPEWVEGAWLRRIDLENPPTP